MLKSIVINVFLLVNLYSFCVGNSKLPTFLKVCHKNDINLNDCVKEAIENLRHLIAKGIPEFGIPSCEPLCIPEVIIDQGDGPVSVKSTYSGIRVYGPSEFQLKSIKIDLDKDKVTLKLWLPHLELNCQYSMEGRILMMPIAGSGNSTGNYSNIDVIVAIQNQRINKDGEIYLNVKDFYVDFNIGHASIKLENLFNGDKQLAKWLTLCERDDPKLDECLTKVLANIFPELAVGIPVINVESFEPLYLDRMSISKDAGPVTLSGSFTNITIIGPSNSTPTYTKLMDIARQKMEFGIYFPRLDISSKYNLKGKILILPLVGNGDCKMSLGGVDTMIFTNISLDLRDGKEILQVKSMLTKFTMSSIKIHLSNLFNGNKLLGMTVNKFLNDHGLEIVKELEETIAESLSEIFLDITNNLFWKLPTELWLPKRDAKRSSLHSKS